MGNRRSYRPSACETLEERVVLSVATATIHTAHAIPTINNTPVRLGPIGTLGDSYTDEYRFYPPDRSVARNWVEMLHTVRLVNFGPYTTLSRGEPRDQGFAYNWARSDATSEDMIANQLPGLTAQVAAGDIRYASIFIGGNDFLHLLDAAAAGLIPPQDIPSALAVTTTQLITNFETAVGTLLAASPNVKVAVWTLPDVGILPIAQEAAATNPAVVPLLEGVSQATNEFNSFVESLGSNPRIAVVDLAGAVNLELASATNGTITVAGQTIHLTTVGDDYHNFFLADGIHPGTVGQGVIADTFVESIDNKFGVQLIPITPQEIIRYAQKVQVTSSHSKGPQLP